MDKSNELGTIIIIAIFISLFLSFFLITVKTENKVSNRLFAFFLILTAIDSSGVLFDALNKGRYNIGMFWILLIFVQLPTFYLYVASICYSDFKLKTRHLLHIVPFLLVNAILLPRFYFVDSAAKMHFLQNSSTMFEIQFNHILLHLQIVFYIIAAFMILRKTKKIYLENYAGASIQSLNWLFQLTVALSFFYGIALLKNIFKFSDYPGISDGLKIGLIVFELIIITWYLLKALLNPELFRIVDSKLALVKDIISEEEKNTPSTVNEAESTPVFQTLNKYMIQEKPFLNPSLTIKEVAGAIDIPVRDLSLLINHTLKQHFYDFVNRYRIEYAMTVLKDPAKSKLTVLEILYEAGFNSKSSFNTAFKKHTGMTPTDYRKQL